jgi:hypothetical protein
MKTLFTLLAATAMTLSAQANALDLSSTAGSTEALVKMRCSLNPQEDVLLWWEGTLFAQQPDKKAMPLLGFEGYNICRSEKLADGTWRLLTRELTFYRDLATGQIIDEWENPFNGQTVDVVHVANDPVNTVLNAPGREVPMPWVQAGDTLMLTLNIPLAYPNPLTPAQFPAESSGPMYIGSEHFMFFTPREAMEDAALSQVPVTYGWTRVGPWLPWMKLGTTPGSLLYVAQGNKRASVDELPADIRQRIARHYPEYATAPSQWVQPNVTSWSYYRDLPRLEQRRD